MRKTSKRLLSLFLSLLMVVSVLPFSAITATADDNSYYLFTYFTGNLQTEQQIRFAVSTDGINFKPLNGGNAILQEKSTDSHSYDGYTNTDGVRDPYIFQGGDGYYYCIATDLEATAYGFWGNQSQMVLWRSADLINWSEPYYINVAQIINEKTGSSLANSDFYRTWAPEVFYENGIYMVYFALAASGYNSTTMYYMTTDDLFDWTHYTAPQQLYSPSLDSANPGSGDAIDADIVKQDGVYYMVFKDEGQATVSLATSTSLTSDYHFVGKFETTQTTGGIEGCQIYTIGNDYYLVADRYGDAGKFAIYNMGSSLSAVANSANNQSIDVTSGNPITTVNETTGFSNLTARHGSVVHITQAQYNSLCDEYGGVTSDDIMYNFTTAYNNTTSGWDYKTYNDSSLHDIDIMFKENGSSAKIAHDSGYATLRNATFFVNDSDVRNMLPDDIYTVSFDYSLESTTNLSAPIFALGTGGDAPSPNTDYVMIFGNGDMWIRKSGESTDTYVGNAALTLGVTYHYDIVSDGTSITFYRDGEIIANIAATVDFPETGTRYVSFGFTDGHSSSGYGYGTYSHIRFRDYAVSASALKSELSKRLIYTKAGGSDTIDGMSGVLNVSNSTGNNLVEPIISYNASSYTLAGWVNPGDVVNYNVIMGIGNNKWSPAPYGRYFAVTEDGQIRFNYCSGSNSGGNWSEHFIDIGNVFTLSANTWSYLQINIVPISNDQVKLSAWVDGISTYSSDISLTTKVDGNNTSGNDYSYGMLGFMQLSTNYMFLGDMGTPSWFHTDNDTSYVKDVAFYAQALNPDSLYNEAKSEWDCEVAKEYVEANYNELNTVPTFTVRPYHINDPVSDGTYSNIVYSPQNTTSWSGNGEGDVATGVGRIDFKVAIPLNSVGVYDGVNDVKFPIMLETKANNTSNSSFIIHYARVDQSNCLELRQDWQGYSSEATDGNSWLYWAGNNIHTNDDFSYRDNNNENESSDSQRDGKSRFWWNILYYNGTGNTDTYYDADKNISFYARTSYKTTSRQNKYGTFTSLTNNYVINYKPVYQIVKGSTKIPGTNYTAYNYYNNVVKGNEWMFTEESLEQYYLAMYKVIHCNPNNYDFSNTESAVISCANEIKEAVNEFNNINLVKKTFNVSFTSANGTVVDTRTITAGDELGTLPENTAITHIDGTLTHNVYSWDTNAQTIVREDTDYTEAVNTQDCTFVDMAHVDSTTQENGYTDKVCSECGFIDPDQRVYDSIDWTEYNAAKAALENKLKDNTYTVSALESVNTVISNDAYYYYTEAQQSEVLAYYASQVNANTQAIKNATASLTPVNYSSETRDLAEYVEELASYDKDMYSKTFTYNTEVTVGNTSYLGLIYPDDLSLQDYIKSVIGSVNTYDIYLNDTKIMSEVPYGTAVRINGSGTAEIVSDITEQSEGGNYAWYYCYSAPSTNNTKTATKYYATAPSYSFYVNGDTYIDAVSTQSTENRMPVIFAADVNGTKIKTFAVAYANTESGEIENMPSIPNYAGYKNTGEFIISGASEGAEFYEQDGTWYATSSMTVTYKYTIDDSHATENTHEVVVYFLDGDELLPLNDYDTYLDIFDAPSASLKPLLKTEFNYNEKVSFINDEFSEAVESLIGDSVYAYAIVDDLYAYANGNEYVLTPITFNRDYSFYAYDNINIIALTEMDYLTAFGKAEKIVINVRDSVVPVYNNSGSVEKFSLVASFAAQPGVTAVEYGYLFTSNTSTIGDDLTLDKVGKNGVARMKGTTLTCGNQFVINIKNPSTIFSFNYVAYVTYTDAEGVHTIYSPVQTDSNNF